MPPLDTLIVNARLCTLADGAAEVIDGGAIGWRQETIAFVGRGELPEAAHVIDAGGALVTPGLIDCHTHLVFAGNRANEFALRLRGASYEEIARAGGGIVSTVAATRAASEDELFAVSLPRARALLADGVTTLEIKSGYGLDLASERRMLRVARRIGTTLGIDVRTTFLGAHAVPSEFAGRADDYIDHVCAVMLPALADEGLVDAVDAFCEGIGFSPAQVRRVFACARALGLPVKLHADQLSDLGGGALAAGFRALSADHLEYASEATLLAMRNAGTVAVLLPGAFYALRETRLPPIAKMRELGIPMAVATDLNPGTSPLQSLRLAMNLACTLFRLTAEEALLGVTKHAAQALGLTDRGALIEGYRADIVIWGGLQRPEELSYWIGALPVTKVFCGGRSGSVTSPAQIGAP